MATLWNDDENPYLRFSEGAGVASRNDDFSEVSGFLLPTLQGSLDERLKNLGFMPFVRLVEGNWDNGNFIGKSMQNPRYQVVAQFYSPKSGSKWTSSNTTVELVLQKLISNQASSDQMTQHCDVIIRVYSQLCRHSGETVHADVEKRAFAHVIEKMVNDIISFYIDAVPSAPFPKQVFHGDRGKDKKREPHDFMNCIACLQGACIRTWQVPEFEIDRLAEILKRQVQKGEVILTAAQSEHVRSLHEFLTTESADSTISSNSSHPSRKEAIGQFMAITRRYIDWRKVEFKNYE